jgi:hypothetical protein
MGTYKGSCFCGAVEFTVTGDPVAMGYCHCKDCRHWSAGPVNGFSLWKPDAVKVTKCADNIFTDHPPMGLYDVYASVLPDLPFKPALHVFYGDTVLHIHDGVPKWKDMPKEMGGSGQSLPD